MATKGALRRFDPQQGFGSSISTNWPHEIFIVESSRWRHDLATSTGDGDEEPAQGSIECPKAAKE
jgi:hypothetical protein